MSALIAFFLSGRLNAIVSTPFCLLVKICILSPKIMKGARDDSRSALGFTQSALDSFENPGSAHAGTDAHRHHTVFQLVAAQRMDHRRGADRTGRAERVAQRDCTAH